MLPHSDRFDEQTLLNHPHECGSGILEAECHGDITKAPKWGDESRFDLIGPKQMDLMVHGISVQERQSLTSRSRVDYLVDAGKRKMSFRAGPIDMLKIDAHAKQIVLFGDHDDIGEPLRVVNLSDKLCC